MNIDARWVRRLAAEPRFQLLIALAAAIALLPAPAFADSADCSALKLTKATGIPGAIRHTYEFHGSCLLRVTGHNDERVDAEAGALWDVNPGSASGRLREAVRIVNGSHPGVVLTTFTCPKDPLIFAASCTIESHTNGTGFTPLSNAALVQKRPLVKTTLAEAKNLSTPAPPPNPAPPPTFAAPTIAEPVDQQTFKSGNAMILSGLLNNSLQFCNGTMFLTHFEKNVGGWVHACELLGGTSCLDVIPTGGSGEFFRLKFDLFRREWPEGHYRVRTSLASFTAPLNAALKPTLQGQWSEAREFRIEPSDSEFVPEIVKPAPQEVLVGPSFTLTVQAGLEESVQEPGIDLEWKPSVCSAFGLQTPELPRTFLWTGTTTEKREVQVAIVADPFKSSGIWKVRAKLIGRDANNPDSWSTWREFAVKPASAKVIPGPGPSGPPLELADSGQVGASAVWLVFANRGRYESDEQRITLSYGDRGIGAGRLQRVLPGRRQQLVIGYVLAPDMPRNLTITVQVEGRPIGTITIPDRR